MTTETMPPPKNLAKRRGRHRCVKAESAILSAAMDLLEEKPLREVTSEAIAHRAGVSKATIYKWWPNKSLVALEAFLSRMQSVVETPDTGSARQDFIEQIKSLIRFFVTPHGRMYAQFIAEGQGNPCFQEQFRERFLKARRNEVRVMWQRGVDRGEIRADVDGDIALDLIYGPIIFRLLTQHASLNTEQAEAIVNAAFRGLQK